MADQNTAKLVVWYRIDGNGNKIPGTECTRNVKLGSPRDGTWRSEGTPNVCCGSEDAILTVINNSTNGSNPGGVVASLVSSDDTINFSGTIAQSGGIRSFIIPNGYNMTFTLTLTGTLTGGVDVNTATIVGTGTISAASPSLLVGSTKSTVFTTSISPRSQYTVVLSDD